VSSSRWRRALRKVLGLMLTESVRPIVASSSGGTMADRLEDFQKFRTDLNEEILGCGPPRHQTFLRSRPPGLRTRPLGTKTKELLGLVASACCCR